MDIPKKGEPIKRHPALQDISRANHDILTFCLNLNLGLRNKTDITRINAYINAITKDFLIQNFDFKTRKLYKLIQSNPLTYQQTQDFKQYFNFLKKIEDKTIEEILEFERIVYTQVRLDERIILNEIQNNCSDKDIQKLSKDFEKIPTSCIKWIDTFWKNKPSK